MAVSEANRWDGLILPGQNELPYSDGEPMESSFHVAQPALLIDTLAAAWSERWDYYATGNMFVYFSARQVKNNDFRGPDVFVVRDAERKPRKSWVAWEEDGRLPDVVIEITSQSTAHVDRGEKKHIYARIWRTAAYFIFDPETAELEGYRLDVDRLQYEPLPANARGDLHVAPLGLWLGLRRTRYREFDQPFVRWLDAAGDPLPSFDERARAEHDRAEHERERAERAELEGARAIERVRELEAELAKRAKPSS